MNSLRDRVYPVTRSSNVSECDVTFERYCSIHAEMIPHDVYICFDVAEVLESM